MNTKRMDATLPKLQLFCLLTVSLSECTYRSHLELQNATTPFQVHRLYSVEYGVLVNDELKRLCWAAVLTVHAFCGGIEAFVRQYTRLQGQGFEFLTCGIRTRNSESYR
jgi:hypothetical protein